MENRNLLKGCATACTADGRRPSQARHCFGRASSAEGGATSSPPGRSSGTTFPEKPTRLEMCAYECAPQTPVVEWTSHVPQCVAAFHHNQEGKITLVLPIAMLVIVLMLGYVGNSGHAVVQKIETQNAADGLAVSAAEWMARGMNSVTTANHLIGEATAVAVIHESFGGPELDFGVEVQTPENQALSSIIRGLKGLAPINGLATYGVPPLRSIDEPFINKVTEYIAPQGEKDKQTAFAAIYDARMTLKRDLVVRLSAKSIANLGLFVPPPWGYLSAAVALGVHAHSEYRIGRIVFEWAVLDGLEAAMKGMKPVKIEIVEKRVVPKLSDHSRVVSFVPGPASKGHGAGRRALEAGLVNLAIEDTERHLEEQYDVKGLVFPHTRLLKLPIEPEPAPSLRGGAAAEGWGSDEPPKSDGENELKAAMDEINDKKADIERRIRSEKDDIKRLEKWRDELDELLRDDDPKLEGAERTEIDQEKSVIETALQKKQERVAGFEADLARLNQQQRQLQQTMNDLASLPKESGNLSIKSIPTKMNHTEERYSQWVRATHPYVDALRAPLLSQFDAWLPKSKMAEHYTKWSNRYTLVKAWQFRSGQRLDYQNPRSARPRPVWKRDNNVDPLAMYVMKGAFTQRGTRRDRKGHELWTRDTKPGKTEAEKEFTLVAIVNRPYQPPFSPKVFDKGPSGITTFAQAIYYNANEQSPARIGATDKTQAKLGWDTLNWNPAFATPEWGSDPQRTQAKWPWEILKGLEKLDSVKVKLNWQAKLMPATRSRLLKAAAFNGVDAAVRGELGDAEREVGAAVPFINDLVTH